MRCACAVHLASTKGDNSSSRIDAGVGAAAAAAAAQRMTYTRRVELSDAEVKCATHVVAQIHLPANTSPTCSDLRFPSTVLFASPRFPLQYGPLRCGCACDMLTACTKLPCRSASHSISHLVVQVAPHVGFLRIVQDALQAQRAVHAGVLKQVTVTCLSRNGRQRERCR